MAHSGAVITHNMAAIDMDAMPPSQAIVARIMPNAVCSFEPGGLKSFIFKIFRLFSL